jgi:hypothetical protein
MSGHVNPDIAPNITNEPWFPEPRQLRGLFFFWLRALTCIKRHVYHYLSTTAHPPSLSPLYLFVHPSPMMQNSPTNSSSSSFSSTSPRRTPEISRSGISCVAGGAVAPMPSLMSHPPRQQIKPQTHLIHHGSPGMPRRLSTPGQLPLSLPYSTSRTPSPSSSRGSSPGPTSYSSPQQDFPCQYCQQVYKKVGHLNRHILTHSGIRFRCEVESCDKTFTRLDNMRTQ